MSASLVATNDPVLKRAAMLAGFADVMVQDTPDGRVVLTRHRFARGFLPYEHLDDGQCAYDAFYGTALWERADVLAMYARKNEHRVVSLDRERRDIRKDFRNEWRREVVRRPDGKNEGVEAIALMMRQGRRR